MLVYILTRSGTELAVYWITIAADMMTLTVLAVDLCSAGKHVTVISEPWHLEVVLVLMDLRKIIGLCDISVNSTQMK